MLRSCVLWPGLVWIILSEYDKLVTLTDFTACPLEPLATGIKELIVKKGLGFVGQVATH